MNLIITGPPFSGKTTQAKNLSRYFGIKHISTGEILRGEIARNSEIGSSVRAFVDNGLFAPDPILNEIFEQEISNFDSHAGVLVDGYPRNIAQFEEMTSIINKKNQKINFLICLEVPEAEWIKRAENRAKMELRIDDNEQSIIKKRFELYNAETRPLSEYASRFGIISLAIDALGSNELVFERIISRIKSLGI